MFALGKRAGTEHGDQRSPASVLERYSPDLETRRLRQHHQLPHLAGGHLAAGPTGGQQRGHANTDRVSKQHNARIGRDSKTGKHLDSLYWLMVLSLLMLLKRAQIIVVAEGSIIFSIILLLFF